MKDIKVLDFIILEKPYLEKEIEKEIDIRNLFFFILFLDK